jgi:hypothetical protein
MLPWIIAAPAFLLASAAPDFDAGYDLDAAPETAQRVLDDPTARAALLDDAMRAVLRDMMAHTLNAQLLTVQGRRYVGPGELLGPPTPEARGVA